MIGSGWRAEGEVRSHPFVMVPCLR